MHFFPPPHSFVVLSLSVTVRKNRSVEERRFVACNTPGHFSGTPFSRENKT